MKKLNSFSSLLASVIMRYLTLKQALGRQYNLERRVLEQLDRFLAARGGDLTAEIFLEWCLTQQHLASGTRREHQRAVRNICLYRRRLEPKCFVPDEQLFPPRHQILRPHLFTDAEIGRLLDVADGLCPTPVSPLRPETFRLAIVILYTTGLRRSELVRLMVGDYEPWEQTLQIRASKFHKSRVVPLSLDGAREIDQYLAIRSARRLPVSADSPLLWKRYRGGIPYTGDGFGQGMRALFRRAGICTAAGRLPRVHDFRHGFAVRSLLRWYQAGANVQAKLPALATYMGHVSIVSTEYYLQFIEPLADAASERFAQYCGAVITSRIDPGGAQ